MFEMHAPESLLLSVSVALSFFLPGLGVTNDPQALGPPDHLRIYMVARRPSYLPVLV